MSDSGCFTKDITNSPPPPPITPPVVVGVILSHYAWHSLSHEAQAGTAIFSHTLSTIAETYCFTALGLNLYRFEVTSSGSSSSSSSSSSSRRVCRSKGGEVVYVTVVVGMIVSIKSSRVPTDLSFMLSSLSYPTTTTTTITTTTTTTTISPLIGVSATVSSS